MKNLKTGCSWRDNGKSELLLKGTWHGLCEDRSLAELVGDFIFLCFMPDRQPSPYGCKVFTYLTGTGGFQAFFFLMG